MKSFTDSLGRAWTLVVNVATIKRVRALCGVDLNTIVEVEDGKPSAKLLEKLSSDPVLLVDVLYAVCKPECDQRNVSDEDFGAAMAGDAVEQATDAMIADLRQRLERMERRLGEMETNRDKMIEDRLRMLTRERGDVPPPPPPPPPASEEPPKGL